MPKTCCFLVLPPLLMVTPRGLLFRFHGRSASGHPASTCCRAALAHGLKQPYAQCNIRAASSV